MRSISGRSFGRIIVRARVGERVERRIEHPDDFGRFIVDDGALFLVPQNRHAGAAAVMRIGQHIDLGERRLAVDGVERAPGSVPNSQPFLPSSASVTETEITSSSFLSLRKISVRCAHGQASET